MAESTPPPTPKTDSTPKTAVTSPSSKTEAAPAPSAPRLSPWTKEIVKLVQSGIEEEVMFAFIDNSGTFALGADEIVYLADLGLSSPVINAMLQHDRELVSGERLPTITSEPPYEPVFKTRTVAKKSSGEPAKSPVAVTSPNPAPEQHATAAPVFAPPVILEERAQPTSTFTPKNTEAGRQRPLYPVRDPQPVELLPPIIFIDAPEIPYNTLIVYGFPKT